jgi:hypothetical protein
MESGGTSSRQKELSQLARRKGPHGGVGVAISSLPGAAFFNIIIIGVFGVSAAIVALLLFTSPAVERSPRPGRMTRAPTTGRE